MTDITLRAPAPAENLTAAIAIAEVAELAYSDPQKAKEMLAQIEAPLSLLYLKDAVWTHVTWAIHSTNGRTERALQEKFFANISQYIEGAKEVDRPMHLEHRPDGFVEIDGELWVVEVKLLAFVGSSLKQLQRYIATYGAVGGIAVAQELRCPLPQNVIFVAVELDGGVK